MSTLNRKQAQPRDAARSRARLAGFIIGCSPMTTRLINRSTLGELRTTGFREETTKILSCKYGELSERIRMWRSQLASMHIRKS